MKSRLLRIPKKLIAATLILVGAAVGAGALYGGVRAVSGSPQTVQLPIVMYHHVLEDPSVLGDYVISPGQLASDLDYIQEKGYTSVLPSEVAAFVRGEGTLPEKPIMITFDDGNRSAYYYAYPLLKERGMKAVLSVIGKVSEHYSEINDKNVSYAHSDWGELAELAHSGVFEIGNHTYDMHAEQKPRRGSLRRKGESVKEYRAALQEDLALNQQLLELAIGSAPKVFAYPYGFIDDAADPVLEQLGFEVTLGVEEKVDTITQGDAQSLLRLGRFNRPYSARTQTFFDNIFSKSATL